MDRCNVVNWIQKIVLHFAVMLIVIAVQQTVDSYILYWLPNLLHMAVPLIVIAVQQTFDCLFL